MFKAFGVATALAMLGSTFATPSFAIDIYGAIEQCALVAAEEQSSDKLQDNHLRGLCLKATADYISTLDRSGMAAEAVGAELASYVVQLANLLEERLCSPESEIPQAIQMSSQASRDPEQAEQIRLISLTVLNCEITTTAAIAAAPAFASGTGSLLGRGNGSIVDPGRPNGPSASAN